MSKGLDLLAASVRRNCLIVRCASSPKHSRTGIGRTRRRAAPAAATGHEARGPADPADAGAILRPRPALRVPTSEEDTEQRGPLVDDASALDSNWTHVQINNELATAQSLEDLFRVIQAGHHRFNKVNAVTALHRIARVRSEPCMTPLQTIRRMCCHEHVVSAYCLDIVVATTCSTLPR
jgi:hypothetical protein